MRKLKRIFTNFIARFQKKIFEENYVSRDRYHHITNFYKLPINFNIPLKILKLAIIKMNKLRNFGRKSNFFKNSFS